MAQRFVIDININGAQGAATQGRAGQDTGIGAAAVGAFAGSRKRAGLDLNSLSAGRLESYNKQTWARDKGRVYVPEEAKTIKKGLISRTYEVPGLVDVYDPKNPEADKYGMATNIIHPSFKDPTGGRIPEFYREHQKQIKTLGIAAAWKSANTMVDLQNYKSGDSYENQKRNNAMKMATYTAAIVGTGFNPVVIAGMVGNEIISGISDYQKYSFDRKMESQQIFNIKQIAGDVSYGINRRGGY